MRNIQPAKVRIYTFIPFCTVEFYFTLGLYQLNEKMNNAAFRSAWAKDPDWSSTWSSSPIRQIQKSGQPVIRCSWYPHLAGTAITSCCLSRHTTAQVFPRNTMNSPLPLLVFRLGQTSLSCWFLRLICMTKGWMMTINLLNRGLPLNLNVFMYRTHHPGMCSRCVVMMMVT